MSVALPVARHSALELNPTPTQKFWFDAPPARTSVEAAAWWYIALDNAAHTQWLAEAAGRPQPIDESTARHTHGQVGGHEGALHAFESLYAGLVQTEPDLLD